MRSTIFLFCLTPLLTVVSFRSVCLRLLAFILFLLPVFFDWFCWVWWFSVLRLVIRFILVPTQIEQIKNKRGGFLLKFYCLLLARLLGCFFASDLIIFYIFFELRALIVFLLVLGLGYQPERLVARLYLLLFTLISSIPFFAYLLMDWRLVGFNRFEALTRLTASVNRINRRFLSVLLAIGFLVKFPIYFFHIWLPKAHVEASARGSMILAGVLLKLGVYGLFRVSTFLNGTSINFILFFSLLGAGLIRILCVRAHDLKILIAYSSVAHMGFLIAALLANNFFGLWGSLGIRVAHGFASSGLFFGAGVFYNTSNSRIIVLNRGQLTWAPWFSLVWCLFCFRNIGTPPTINFWTEVFLILRVARVRQFTLFLIGVSLFMRVVFSLLLFLLTQRQKESTNALFYFAIRKKTMLIVYLHLLGLLFRLIYFPLVFR